MKRPVTTFHLIAVCCLLALLPGLFSCKKDISQIGLSILPPSDTLNVKTTDTITVIAYSVIQDSARTDEPSTMVLGSMNDPVFGKTTASFYSQFRLSTDAVSFGVNPELDSLVLVLQYGSVYGDTNTWQNIKVYELSEDIHLDSSYYSNQTLDTYSTQLADQEFRPRMHDSLKVGTAKVTGYLRVRLDKMTHYLGNKIISAPSSVLVNNEAFLPFMKGLYVTSSPVYDKGALCFFNVSKSVSKLVVYFHNQDSDSLNFEMPMNDAAARFVNFNHYGYADADPAFQQQVLQHDTALGREMLYMQGTGGIRIKLQFPYLKDFSKLGKIAINDALLTFYNAEKDTTLAPPPQIYYIKIDSIGRIGFMVDEGEGEGYFGGMYMASTGSYQFRLTRYMQQLILGKDNQQYSMYITAKDPTQAYLTGNRVTIVGTQPGPIFSPGMRFKLSVIYTKMF